MSAITQCPTCNTRFKVSQEQLDAHEGMVRCGRCQMTFNAAQYLQDNQPNPQLELPIAEYEPQPTPVAVAHKEPGFSHSVPDRTETQKKTLPSEHVALAKEITVPDNLYGAPSKPTNKKNAWAWTIGILLLLIVLMAQVAYFFRIELAASLPGYKPALISYCNLLQCTVPLPQKADLVNIESSDLEADPAQASAVTLNALLRNHAPYAQTYPNLELTLTDTQDRPLARRTFRPAEYLKPGEDEKQGFAANRELSVRLSLDTNDLRPSGYRLFLFYPQ